MANQGGQSGPATLAARQVSNKINQAAQRLEHREPGHVVDEVKNFARRRPGVFFAGADVLGVVSGPVDKEPHEPSSTARRTGTRRSSPIPCRSPWRRTGATVRPRRSSGTLAGEGLLQAVGFALGGDQVGVV
jgi:hypothetical protein